LNFYGYFLVPKGDLDALGVAVNKQQVAWCKSNGCAYSLGQRSRGISPPSKPWSNYFNGLEPILLEQPMQNRDEHLIT